MIVIKKSPTADTRSCDFRLVDKETLRESTITHIGDVCKGLYFFSKLLERAGVEHDRDKLTKLDSFHAEFRTGFKEHEWLDGHRANNRHHLDRDAGVPKDVNLLDVLEYIDDCVMASKARSGEWHDLKLSDELLQKAVRNTVELLQEQVVVEGDDSKA